MRKKEIRICKECGSSFIKNKGGRPRKYCNQNCSTIADNKQRIERRNIKQTPDKLARLLSKTLQGDQKASEKLSALMEKVLDITDQKEKEKHINKLESDLETIQDLMRKFINPSLSSIEQTIKWKLETANVTPAREFKTMKFYEIDPVIFKNLKKKNGKMKVKKNRS